MVFSSPVFLFLFLPLVLALHVAMPKGGRNALLLAASLLFYAWGEGLFVAVMLVSIALNHLAGVALDRRRGGAAARLILGLGVAANLALLGAFKYANFLVDNLNAALPALGLAPVQLDPVHLPVGISFFTFQAMSYLVDVYRAEAPARHGPLQVALYIALFPQLIAGPIVRYHQVARQIVERLVTFDDFAHGVQRFTIGLGKKMLVANPLGAVADQVFALPAADLSAPLAWLGIACYTLQIYFDFSGYSDMAIGLGRLFGFHFPENFNYPYISRSVREFWRRWHMSLSGWFRDYLYLPLGGNRLGGVRTGVNLLTVFLLCGLWHGASWNFVIWGLLHGAFLALERGPWGRLLDAAWAPLRHAYALLVVMVAWVFFRAETLPDALGYLAAMAGLSAGDPARSAALYLDNEVLLCLAVGAAGSLPLIPRLADWRDRRRDRGAWGTTAELAFSGTAALALCLLLAASAMGLAAGTYNPFIYFRF
ncbi:MAG: MBOAT family protein [Nitrospirae bacterium]|nr:MBOAT family protein [Nitrospirota bacterium]